MKDLYLDCVDCGEFTEAYTKKDDPDSVVRCNECGKKHSDNSLYFVDPNANHERDEAGNLIEDLP